MHDSHTKAAEYHDLAAHAHRAAAASHDQQDHETGREHSRQALDHANKAYLLSQEAHNKSGRVEKLPAAEHPTAKLPEGMNF